MSLWPTISNCFCFMYHPKPWPFAKIHWLPFPRHDICWLSQVILLFSPFRCYLRLDIPYIFNESHLGTIWVCLKIGYVSHPNAHFGKIIIDQGNGVIGVPYFQIVQEYHLLLRVDLPVHRPGSVWLLQIWEAEGTGARAWPQVTDDCLRKDI